MTKIAILSGIQPQRRAVAGQPAAIAGAWARTVVGCKGTPAGSGTPRYSQTCKCAGRWHDLLATLKNFTASMIPLAERGDTVGRFNLIDSGNGREQKITLLAFYRGSKMYWHIEGGRDVAIPVVVFEDPYILNDACEVSKPNRPFFEDMYQRILQVYDNQGTYQLGSNTDNHAIPNLQGFIWTNFNYIYPKGKELPRVAFDRTAYQQSLPGTGQTGQTGNQEAPLSRPPKIDDGGDDGDKGDGDGDGEDKKGLTTPQKIGIGIGVIAAVGIAAALYNINK